MLTIDKPIQIAGKTFYRDTEIPHKVYFVGEPMYRCNKYGHPKVSLLKYRWGLEFEGARGGGLLLFDFLLSVDEKVLNSIHRHLNRLNADLCG